jgi:predicted TIM-barrel fold metal-dependent hydrolase
MATRLPLTRRRFLAASAVGAGVVMTGQGSPGVAAVADAGGAAKKPLVIDCHAHLAFRASPDLPGDDASVLEAADKLGIDRLCCSVLPKRPASVEGFQAANRVMAAAAKRHPERLLGYCFVNPEHQREAVDEIRRCVEQFGFIGVKLYNEHVCTDPVVFPVVEAAISLGVPILHHAGHSHYAIPTQPHISDGGHLAELSRRYPEAKLICAHVGGGGDWEWTIKALRHAQGVFLDTSGSVVDEGMVDMAVKVLGADRLLFGCDMSFTAGVGKVRGARLSDEERRKILGLNMLRLLERKGGTR